jgi:hypothetical protein
VQKSGYDSPQTFDSPEMAWMRHEMDQFERRIDQKLELLAQSIERLAAAKRLEDVHSRPSQQIPQLVPIPVAEEADASQASYSTYRFAEPTPRTVNEPPQVRRLPPMNR